MLYHPPISSVRGTTLETRTYIAGACDICKEERDVLEEEMRKLDVVCRYGRVW